jgi:membrane-associated phospholipid phosphatase
VPREQIRGILVLAIVYSLVFDILYGAASVFAVHVPWRVHVDFPFEARVPFVPDAAAIYLTVLPLLMMAPFALRNVGAILPLVVALILETVVGFLGFMLLPVEASAFDRALPATDSALYNFANWLNLEGNYLPSLHVAFAVTATLAYCARTGAVGKTILITWTVAIALSTLLIHQHYVLDVITGAALAWACWRFARRHSKAISGWAIRG